MVDVMKHQYNLIRATRERLFTFLEGIPLRDLRNLVPNFGNGRIIKDKSSRWLDTLGVPHRTQI